MALPSAGSFSVLVQGTGKAYVYPLGVSESTVQFAGADKQYPEHRYATSNGVPVEKLFDKSPKPQSRKRGALKRWDPRQVDESDMRHFLL